MIKKCNRCKCEDNEGYVITQNFKPEGYMCSECAKEHWKNVDDMANKFSSGLDVTKTLRDEFAMAALNAFLECETFRMEHTKDVSKSSYEIADAMLEARKVKGE